MKKLQHLGAPILSLTEFAKLRSKLKGKIVMTSGGFDPVHPGHISCFMESKKMGDILVVAINGDLFLKAKKGASFQNLETRSLIVSGIRYVDYVVPFEAPGDISAAQALAAIQPHIYTKGGNRVGASHMPKGDLDAFKKYNIQVKYRVGIDKIWSSSDFLEQWVAFRTQDPEAIKRVKEFYKLSYAGSKKK
ncbi:MAG: adenylyltransferase/cytidyltransferase family protein [Patescibacteria group bacterium]